MHAHLSLLTCVCAFTHFRSTIAIDVSITDSTSVKSTARTITKDLLGYYNGDEPGNTVGLYSDQEWLVSGYIWDSIINYWGYTGDAQYNDVVQQALLHEAGPNSDFMPANQTKTEGNDDQGAWALAAMTAAELKLPNASGSPSWLDHAVNVFNDYVLRWDTKTCGGGLRWQIFTFNAGYTFKNSASNGAFFQLAARLARHTGNQTYAEWAEKAYDWSTSVAIISSDFSVYDGAMIDNDCKKLNKLQWSNNAAHFLYGSAMLYNYTNGNTTWRLRTQGLLTSMSTTFFQSPNNASNAIITEVACEPQKTCNTLQPIYKGLASKYLGATTQVAPFTLHDISNYLQASAKGAAQACTGNPGGTACGFKWTEGFDGKTGVGQELSALNVMLANLAMGASAPSVNSTNTSGGTAGSGPATGSGTNGTTTSGSAGGSNPISTYTTGAGSAHATGSSSSSPSATAFSPSNGATSKAQMPMSLVLLAIAGLNWL